MTRRRKRKPDAPPPPANERAKPPAPTARGYRSKLWQWRLLAIVFAPLVCFGILELCLRLAGYGYPTGFLLRSTEDGTASYIQNNKFGWRFFGPQIARLPYPLSFSATKPPGTVRIFVFGESAAKGDPAPRFGLPRMLQAVLSLRHPETHFEVLNAAMTGINSHAVRAIARDCAGAGGDIWVVYMGNNEVVGPFGAGTVFSPQTPPLPLIRASLTLKATRTGQWLDSLRQRLETPSSARTEWGGMEMFLEQQVAADDPRMSSVYHHFTRNLSEIVHAGESSGASVVVSTVAVNLRDCAPFASAHRLGLSQTNRAEWERLYGLGIQAQDVGKLADAAAQFAQAERIDETFADLRFREGECALGLGLTNAAQDHFRAARDLDTLRFRCDSKINELTRQFVASHPSPRVVLADAEKVFADHRPAGLPGENLFYEHVHPNFDGNYLLASTIAAGVEKFLPAATAPHAWPSMDECAWRLAWTDWSRHTTLSDVYVRVNQAPFTGQMWHEARKSRLLAALSELAPAGKSEGLRSALKTCEMALSTVPDDASIAGQVAELKELTGDFSGAETAERKSLALLPSNAEGWSELGIILTRRQQPEAAADAFSHAVELNPQDIGSMDDRAQVLAASGRAADAEREYRAALSISPHFGVAWLGLGQLLDAAGRKTEADECYRQALGNRVHRTADLAVLAAFFQQRNMFDVAATNYAAAARLDPLNPQLRLQAGRNFVALGRYTEAADQFREAAQLAPDLAEAHFLLGSVLGQQQMMAEAVREFQEALRLRPDLVQARVNLGVALVNLGRNRDAREQFSVVLQQSPTNSVALKYTQALSSAPDVDPR